MDTPADYLVPEVAAVLAEDPGVSELGLKVTVVGDTVYLGGTVPTAERRDRISQVLGERFPDVTVCNEIEVCAPGPPAAAERLT